MPVSVADSVNATQVETEGQMAYLHYRLNQCPHENRLIDKARQVAKLAGRPAAHTAPHKVMPLQVPT